MAGACQSDNRTKDSEIGYLNPNSTRLLKDNQNTSRNLSERFLSEVNEMRCNPPQYAQKINDIILKKMNGHTHSVTHVAYFEGKDAFKEAELILKSTNPLPSL